MESFLEPPRQMFDMSNSSRVRVAFEEPAETNESTQNNKEEAKEEKEEKDVKKKKKFSGFSLSSFKTNASTVSTASVTPIVSTTENNEKVERVEKVENVENDQNMGEDDDILVFSYPLSKKLQYQTSNSNLVFTQTPRRAINFTDISAAEARQRQRQIEERVAIDDVMDMFGNGERQANENLENDRISSAISDALTKLVSCEVVMKKDKTSSSKSVLPEVFFSYLYDMFQYLNPEERAKIIIHAIFGGLITRVKLTGAGGKSGISKFAELITTIGKLENGASNSNESKLYTQVKAAMLSTNLNKYRSDSSAGDQVTNVTTLIRKIATAKLPVHFPSTITVSDPFQMKDSSGKISPVKTISLSGAPVLLNLNTFFEKPVEQKVVKAVVSKKKKYDDDDDDENADTEDRMTDRAGKKW